MKRKLYSLLAVVALMATAAVAMTLGLSQSVAASDEGAAAEVVFEEHFDLCTQYGGWDADGNAVLNSAYNYDCAGTEDTYFAEAGWSVVKGYPCLGCMKFGASTTAGYAITPALTNLTETSDITIAFKAAPWTPSGATAYPESNSLTVSVAEGAGTVEGGEITLTQGSWGDYTVVVRGADATTKIQFYGNLNESDKNGRFYLDDVVITKGVVEEGGSTTVEIPFTVTDASQMQENYLYTVKFPRAYLWTDGSTMNTSSKLTHDAEETGAQWLILSTEKGAYLYNPTNDVFAPAVEISSTTYDCASTPNGAFELQNKGDYWFFVCDGNAMQLGGNYQYCVNGWGVTYGSADDGNKWVITAVGEADAEAVAAGKAKIESYEGSVVYNEPGEYDMQSLDDILSETSGSGYFLETQRGYVTVVDGVVQRADLDYANRAESYEYLNDNYGSWVILKGDLGYYFVNSSTWQFMTAPIESGSGQLGLADAPNSVAKLEVEAGTGLDQNINYFKISFTDKEGNGEIWLNISTSYPQQHVVSDWYYSDADNLFTIEEGYSIAVTGDELVNAKAAIKAYEHPEEVKEPVAVEAFKLKNVQKATAGETAYLGFQSLGMNLVEEGATFQIGEGAEEGYWWVWATDQANSSGQNYVATSSKWSASSPTNTGYAHGLELLVYKVDTSDGVGVQVTDGVLYDGETYAFVSTNKNGGVVALDNDFNTSGSYYYTVGAETTTDASQVFAQSTWWTVEGVEVQEPEPAVYVAWKNASTGEYLIIRDGADGTTNGLHFSATEADRFQVMTGSQEGTVRFMDVDGANSSGQSYIYCGSTFSANDTSKPTQVDMLLYKASYYGRAQQVTDGTIEYGAQYVICGEGSKKGALRGVLDDSKSYGAPVIEEISELTDVVIPTNADAWWIAVDPADLDANVIAAAAVLEKTGVGYPTTDAEARTTLQAAIDAYKAGESDAETLAAAVKTYKADKTSIAQPESGKWYRIAFTANDGTKYYESVSADHIISITNDEAEAAVFQARTEEAGTVVFVTPEGYFYKTNSYNQGNYKDLDNSTTMTFAARATRDAMTSITLAPYAAVEGEEDFYFGKMSVYGMRGYNNNAYVGAIRNEAASSFGNQQYVNGSSPVQNENFACAAAIEEVSATTYSRYSPLEYGDTLTFGEGLSTFYGQFSDSYSDAFEVTTDGIRVLVNDEDKTAEASIDYAYYLKVDLDGVEENAKIDVIIPAGAVKNTTQGTESPVMYYRYYMGQGEEPTFDILTNKTTGSVLTVGLDEEEGTLCTYEEGFTPQVKFGIKTLATGKYLITESGYYVTVYQPATEGEGEGDGGEIMPLDETEDPDDNLEVGEQAMFYLSAEPVSKIAYYDWNAPTIQICFYGEGSSNPNLYLAEVDGAIMPSSDYSSAKNWVWGEYEVTPPAEITLASADPAEGTVETLDHIRLTFEAAGNDVTMWWGNWGSQPTLTCNGEAVEAYANYGNPPYWDADNNEWNYDYDAYESGVYHVVLKEAATAEGTYVLTIPAEHLAYYNSDTEDYVLNSEMTLTWTIGEGGEVVDYSTNWDDQNSAHASRYTTGVVLTHADGSEQESSTLQTGAGQAIVWDMTDTDVFEVAPGEEVTVSVNFQGSWMHAYVYVDEDGDGFQAEADNENHTFSGDLKAFSFYAYSDTSDETGYDSAGAYVTGNNRNSWTMPAFTVPATEGTYRMRVKVDWSSIDPAGQLEYLFGGNTQSNGGIIYDAMLHVDVANGINTAASILDGATIYDLQGRRVERAIRGLYIVNGKKMYIK